MLKYRFLIAVASLALVAGPAQATISYYSNSSAYAAGTSDLTNLNISFDSLTLGSDFNSYTNPTGDVTFTGSPNPGGYNDANNLSLTVLAQPAAGWPSGQVLARTGLQSGSNIYSGGSVTITFSQAVRAVAFLVSYVAYSNTINIVATTASNATDSHNVSVIPSSPFFEGVRADEPITSIVITASGNFNEQIQMGAVEFADAANSTPEPSPMLLLAAGAGLLGLWKYVRCAT